MAERGDKNKHDDGKRMWDLLPYSAVGQVVDVLNYGARKYGEDSWKGVGRERYFPPAMRHLTAGWEGEMTDPESGIHHLAHAACNVLFMLWLDDNKIKKD